jgi:hypothetical protein
MILDQIPQSFNHGHEIIPSQPVTGIHFFKLPGIPALENSAFQRTVVIYFAAARFFIKKYAAPAVLIAFEFDDIRIHRCQTPFDIVAGQLAFADGIEKFGGNFAFFNQDSIFDMKTGAALSAAGAASDAGRDRCRGSRVGRIIAFGGSFSFKIHRRIRLKWVEPINSASWD